MGVLDKASALRTHAGHENESRMECQSGLICALFCNQFFKSNVFKNQPHIKLGLLS